MRITFIKLVNFKNIFTAMKKKLLEIDFSKGSDMTPINILVGGNGSGKTSILSMLQPFSFVGTLDIRNSVDMILENHDGYKEIHIVDCEDKYVIKHYYTQSKSGGRTIKSFISRNGEELNQNGNVTSFKELVSSELGLEQDFLKLLRLGSNVTNFINMKASERKSFTTDLLSDVDVYSTIYKKISDNVRIHAAMIKTVGDRLNRLSVKDENESLRELEDINREIENITTSIATTNIERGKIAQSLDSLLDGNDLQEYVSQIKYLEKSYRDKVNKIENIKEKMSRGSKYVIDYSKSSNEIYENIQKRITECGHNIENLQAISNIQLVHLSGLHEKEFEKKLKISDCKTKESIKECQELIDTLKGYVKEKAPLFKEFNPTLDKEDLINAINVVQHIDKAIMDILEYDFNAVSKVIELIMSKKDVNAYSNSKMTKLYSKIEEIKMKLHDKENGGLNRMFIAFKPVSCNTSNCPFEAYYNAVMSKNKDRDLYLQLDRLEKEYDFYGLFRNIQLKIDTITMIIKTNINILKKIPKALINPDLIHKTILDRESINFYNEEQLTELIGLLDEYDEYNKSLSKIEELEKELRQSSKLLSLENEMEEEYNELVREIKGLNKQHKKVVHDIDNHKKQLNLMKEFKDFIETTVFQFNELCESVQDDKKELDLKDKQLAQIKSLNEELLNMDNSLSLYKKRYNILLDNKIKLSNDLDNFRSFNKELNELETAYDELKIVREAVSSTKGIPLLFIQLYLKNTKNKVNELLYEVFGDDLQVDEFIINDKEFKIPFIKNGLRVDDISFASQGEASFISLALSFALIEQSIKKYNILLLDEIDSTLDTSNRSKFIRILECQLKSINAEQAFLITHNNMFDSYPVNIVMTSNVDLDNYSNMTIVHKQ